MSNPKTSDDSVLRPRIIAMDQPDAGLDTAESLATADHRDRPGGTNCRRSAGCSAAGRSAKTQAG